MTYYGASLLMFEASTPFLNLRWFLGQFGWTKSALYMVNTILFATVFFLARIIYGISTCYEGLETLYEFKAEVEIPVFVFIVIAAFSMNFLNLYWFFKIIKAALVGESKSKDIAEHHKTE